MKTSTGQTIVHETGKHYISTNAKGHYEVYRQGDTAAQRVAYVGYPGQKGLDRAKSEIASRESASTGSNHQLQVSSTPHVSERAGDFT